MIDRLRPYLVPLGIFASLLGLAGVPTPVLVFLIAASVCAAVMACVAVEARDEK